MGSFFVNRPIMAIVIAIIMVIVGFVSLVGLPIEQYPNIAPPIVEVRTNYVGANSLTLEKSVATPLEQEINGVDNMLYMKSTNASDGSVTIQVTFDIGTNPDMNTVFTQNRVTSATSKLPEEVKRFGVVTQKSQPNILMIVAITSDKGYSQEFLGNYTILNIKDQLSRINGIGRINLFGSSDYSMRIWVKPDRLAQLNISTTDISNAIKAQNLIVPGGKFGAEPAPKGTEFTYSVRLPERLQTEEEFGNIIVRTESDGSQIKVKDVARVELGVESYNAFTRYNGKTCAMMAIYQAPGSNSVELVKKIRATMDHLSKSFPKGIKYDVTLDSSTPVTAGIEEILHTLLEALILVILMVFIFIQDLRATLIPIIAIPVALVATFMFFPLLGFSINVLSLLGLVLAIGLVVDDAIVVVEAVQHKIEHGMNPKEATIEAMKEVTGPIIATTLVIIAVFLPVAFMGGITGTLFKQFAITIAVSFTFSAINSLTLSPALCALFLRKPEPMKGPLGFFFKGFNKVFDKSTKSYLSFTSIVSRKFARSFIFIAVIVIFTGAFAKFVPNGFMPDEDQGYIMLNIQSPPSSSLQRSDQFSRQVEEILKYIPEIEKTTVVTGFNMFSGSMSTSNSFFFISLKDWAKRKITAKELIKKINGMLFMKIQGANAFSFGPAPIPGVGNGTGYSIMIQDKAENSPEYLAKHLNNFIAKIKTRKEIGSAFSTFQASVPQKQIEVDVDKILKSGIPISELYSTIGTFLGGSYVNDFNRFGRLYKTYIQAENEYRQDEKGIGLFMIKSPNGNSVPLSSFIKVSNASGPDFTNRFNLYRAAEVSGVPSPGYSSNDAMVALEEVAKETLPNDMGFEWNALSYQEKKSSGSTMIIFMFSLVFVFLILAAQYESWSLPLSILLGTPFALFGAFMFLYFFRLSSETYELNLFSQISLVLLIAMGTKNAILIVEFAKLKFDEGMSLFDSAIESARLRFRPILMTALAFILGVVPLILASGAGAEARKVMGVTLVGGTLLATLIGVFMYPMFFVFIGKVFKYEQKRDKLKSKLKDE